MDYTIDSKDVVLAKSIPAVARVPSVAGRLRVANQTLRAQMLDYVHRAGFPEVTYTQILVFRHEGPDGRQPTEIAASARLSKQMINELLGQLENAGYLKRKPHPEDGRGRVVRLTGRGRRLDAAIWEAGRMVERDWAARIGEPAWGTFRNVLDQLARSEADTLAVDGGS